MPVSIPSPDPAEHRKSVREALENAELLVAFASRNALKAQDLEEQELDTLIASIAQARASFDASGLDAAAEAKLFSDLRHLAAAFLPVTASSIRDSSEAVGGPRRYFFCGNPISHAAAAVRRFSICSSVALILLLWIQIVWLVGYDVVSRWRALEKEKIVANQAAKEALRLAGKSVSGNAAPADSTDAERNRGIQQQALMNLMKGWWARFGISMLSSSSSNLTPTPQNARPEPSPTATSESATPSVTATSSVSEATVQETLPALASPTSAPLGETTPTPQPTPTETEPQGMPPSPHNIESDVDENIRTLVAVETEVNIIQTYVLPLFYGLIGSCAFVLRQLGIEIRSRTFRRELGITYWLHIFLGVLAGLAIGWFLRPEGTNEGLIRGLTPFALSFLAGYSVEVLFSAMDRLVAAFGSARTDKGTS